MQTAPELRASAREPEVIATRRAILPICDRITAHAKHAPNHLAVVDGSTPLTYAHLEDQANQLAACLLQAGVSTEDCVGLFLDRSAQFVVSALAVLKCGAAYLPFDTSTPTDRIAFILADSGARLLLTHRGKTPDVPTGSWRILDVDSIDNSNAVPSPKPITVRSEWSTDNLAYVIYTSGSTGRPKGVEITHGNLLNLIEWHQSAFQISMADRASQVAGLAFDAAVWEIWPHLTAGATLLIADDATRRSPQALRDWLVSEKVTICFAPTVLAEQMLQASWPAEASLRYLLTGADTLRRRPIASLPFVVVNNYGPTECTVVATSGVVAPEDGTGIPTIGRPISNASILVLDGTLRPVPAGEVGELCIAGTPVGRGYRNHPELTTSRFVDFTPDSGSAIRIYRTGDRGRFLPNGEIAFVGRIDEQVKIRGYRVELGEITASLDRCPGVEGCAVLARDHDAGPILVAYIVSAPEARLTATDLREFLATRLPDYMIPAQFVAIRTLPMTVNGKLDKSALPAPTAENQLPTNLRLLDAGAITLSVSPDAYVEKISVLVAALVGQPSVGPEENFFMLGGHSLLGVQLVARIKDLFGVKLTLRQLFKAPTVGALAAEVKRFAQSNGH